MVLFTLLYHYGKCIENACLHEMTNFIITYIVFLDPKMQFREHQTLLFPMDIKLTIFSIHGQATYNVPRPFLFSRHIFTIIGQHKYTSAYIYLTDFGIKFKRFTSESHIAAYIF